MTPIDEKMSEDSLRSFGICIGEQLIHEWGRMSWFKSREQQKVEEDLK